MSLPPDGGERGAVPGDHDLYLAGFADDDHQCLRLLLSHLPDASRPGFSR